MQTSSTNDNAHVHELPFAVTYLPLEHKSCGHHQSPAGFVLRSAGSSAGNSAAGSLLRSTVTKRHGFGSDRRICAG